MSSIWALLFLALSSVPYSFESEKVTMTLDSTSVVVEGEYTFRNLTDERVEAYLYYPFPLDSADYPDEIIVEEADFNFTPRGIKLNFTIEPEGRKTIRVRYVQKLKSAYARYILRSTRSWVQPLKEAYFKVSMPSVWKKIHISIPLDEVEINNGERTFSGTFSDFMPESDLIVRWSYGEIDESAEDQNRQ